MMSLTTNRNVHVKAWQHVLEFLFGQTLHVTRHIHTHVTTLSKSITFRATFIAISCNHHQIHHPNQTIKTLLQHLFQSHSQFWLLFISCHNKKPVSHVTNVCDKFNIKIKKIGPILCAKQGTALFLTVCFLLFFVSACIDRVVWMWCMNQVSLIECYRW